MEGPDYILTLKKKKVVWGDSNPKITLKHELYVVLENTQCLPRVWKLWSSTQKCISSLLIEMTENQNKYDYVNILMKVPSRPSLTYALGRNMATDMIKRFHFCILINTIQLIPNKTIPCISYGGSLLYS